MKKLGLSLAMGLVPFPALAVTVNVDAGTTATGGLINPVVTQNVYGTANDFSIYGTQQVMSGGLTNNSNVFSGGYQNISSGGTSNNSTIQVNAVQSISGTANGTKVEGSSTINRGGIANNTIVNGGKLSVLTGGSSVGTVLNSGTESVTGTSKDAIINGGLQQINRNGSATGTQINGGEQNIAVRGTATGSIISGGVQNVYGDAYTSEIKNNGTMNVYSTGYAENTNINGGTMIVNSGAFVSDTILNSGVEDVYGYDLNGTINGGTQYIENEGQADETTIQNAGTQQILSGGYGYNARIYRGGTQIANAGGYAYRSNIYDGGTLKAIGEAHESTIHDGGFLTVADEGKAIDTTINGGVLTVESGGTSQNTILSSGVENVYGTANGTQINGGEQNVYGLANNSVISTNGSLKVLSGGKAVDTSLNGGVLTVESDGTSQNTILSSGVENVYGTANGTQINGGEQNVYGLANNSVISANGSLKVLSGGTAVDTTINGGVLTVESGGTSQNTILSSGVEDVYGTANGTQINGGEQNVYGLANNSVISTNGSLKVLSGGKAVDTSLNGGVLTVESGGTSQNTILSSGVENVYGTANGTQINGGEQNVYGLANNSVISTNGSLKVLSGGKAVDTSLNGGVLTVESGGTSQNTILSSGVEDVYGTANGTQINGGEQNVYGLANNSVISTNGSLKVLSGGKAVDTDLNGGVLTVESGGTSQNTILSSGVENVYGTANGTQINGGKQNVYGLVTNAVITKGTQNIYGQARNTAANGGIITVFSGGETENTTLNNGTLNLQQNGKLSGTTIASTSLINIIGNNTITDLELDKSLVNMVKTNQYSTLDIENLNGTGLFRMNTNMSSSEADFINIKNGKGEFGLIVNDYSMDNAPNKYKIIDEGTATKDNFYLVGGAADVGAYQYKLVQEGNDWYLENTNKPNDTTYMAKNTYSSLSSLFYTHITPVYSRLYEKHGKHKHEGGIWTKGIGRRIKQNFDDGTSSQTDVYGASIGIDHSIIEGKDYQIRLGGYTGYSHSRQEFDQQGKSEGNTQSFGLYSSLTTENQWFLDLLGAYVTHNQSVNSYTPAGDAVIGKYDTYGWQTSLIGGRRFNFENSLYFEPHVALGYMWIKGISYRTNFNTLIEGSDQDNLKMSIGMTGGKTYQITEDATAEIFGKFSIIHDWKSESKVQVVDYLMKEDMSATHYKLGAGVKGNWDDNKSAFFEISTHMGNKVTMPYEITIGYQYEF